MTASDRAPLVSDRTRRAGWGAVLVALVFGFLFAYDVWEAVGNLIGLDLQARALGVAVSPLGWTVLIAGIALPVAAYTAALLLGRGRPLRARALLLVTAWAAVAVAPLDSLALGPASLLG